MLSNCDARLTIDLKDQPYRLIYFEATEELGKPFEITADIVAQDTVHALNLTECIGNMGTVTIVQADEAIRYFNGILTEATFERTDNGGFVHHLTLRPRSYMMDHNKDYRIFQSPETPTTKEIICQILQENAQTFDWQVTATMQDREYCVQYGESDFAFISRLMEEEGVYYYYDHSSADHKMILCDAPRNHKPGVPSELNFNEVVGTRGAYSDEHDRGDSDYILSWHEILSSGFENVVTMRDYDFEKTEIITADFQVDQGHQGFQQEVYNWPGGFGEKADGVELSTVELQALRARRQIFKGESATPALCLGKTFTMHEHGDDRFNDKTYTLIRTHTGLYNRDYASGSAADYENFCRIEAIFNTVQWRSEKETPSPIVNGVETAIVTGPEKETIYTDEYGRVKVRFHWDRSGSKGEASTCWIRVSWTGGLGNIILPRVGHEVIVDFIDGSPDNPIIVGRVFNSQNMPVYDLPAQKTKALWKSLTYGDTPADKKDYDTAEKLSLAEMPMTHEIRFEDKAGEEELFIYASRFLNTYVRQNECLEVGKHRSIKIGGNETKEVKLDETITIHQNSKLTVDQDNDVTIKGNKTVEIDKDEKRTTKGNVTIDVTGNHDEKVKGNYSLDVTGKLSIKAMEIELTAQTGFTLTVGQCKIKLDPMQLSAEGMMVAVKGQIQTDIEGLMTNVKGSAMTIVKGGIVMIN